MTNEDRLLKALNDFKEKYPNVTSADLQTFIIGWNEASKDLFISEQRELLIDFCGTKQAKNIQENVITVRDGVDTYLNNNKN